jgi:cytochrome c oxidase subunit 5b
MSSQSASSSSSQSSDANVVTDFEHSTGLYRAELEGLAHGKDIFDHYDFTRAPKGTKESPCVVTSEMDYRVVGVTDPDDDSIVIWGRLEEGKGPMLIGDEWFVHKRVGGGGH